MFILADDVTMYIAIYVKPEQTPMHFSLIRFTIFFGFDMSIFLINLSRGAGLNVSFLSLKRNVIHAESGILLYVI